jgi:hypothetical protein
MIKPIKRVSSRTDTEQQRLVDEAVSVRDRLLGLGAEADLDAFDFLARPDPAAGDARQDGMAAE